MASEAKFSQPQIEGSSRPEAPLFLRIVGFLKGARRFFTEPVALALAGAIELSGSNSQHLSRMLKSGQVSNLRGRQGMTPLLYSIIRSKPVATEALLSYGADPNAKADNGQGVMSLAAVHPSPDFLKLALHFGGDPNTRDKLGMPILSRAVENHLTQHVDILLHKQADVNAPDLAGNSSLATAITVGWADLIGPLLSAGADMDHRNEFGTSAREMALQEWQSPSLRQAFDAAVNERHAVDSDGFPT